MQAADTDELDRVEAALRAGERLSVTTTVAGAGAGQKSLSTGRGPPPARFGSPRTRSSSTTPPAPVMMVFGAVDTAQALRRMAKLVGFHTVVSDARGKFATRERLPDADEVVVGWPAMAYDLHGPDEATYVVVLTHDARFDEPALGPALRSSAPYIGALGSRRARDSRRRRLLNAGYSEDEIGRIRGPLGLDIGAVTPAETAVSILAEVLAVRANREGGALSHKAGRIHPGVGRRLAAGDARQADDPPRREEPEGHPRAGRSRRRCCRGPSGTRSRCARRGSRRGARHAPRSAAPHRGV